LQCDARMGAGGSRGSLRPGRSGGATWTRATVPTAFCGVGTVPSPRPRSLGQKAVGTVARVNVAPRDLPGWIDPREPRALIGACPAPGDVKKGYGAVRIPQKTVAHIDRVAEYPQDLAGRIDGISDRSD